MPAEKMGSEGWKLVRISQGQYKDAEPAIDQDKERLFCCSGKDVFIYEANEAKLLGRLRHFENVVGVQLHPYDSSLVITCTSSGILSFWSPKAEVVIREIDLNAKRITSFRIYPLDEAAETLSCYFVSGEKPGLTGGALFSVSIESSEDDSSKKTTKFLEKNVSHDSRLISYSKNAIAWITKNDLFIRFNKDGKKSKFNYHTEIAPFSAIAYHERSDCLAAGDESGRLLIWENASKGIRSCTQRLHWHHMPLLTIGWSPEGTTIYTGGQERVLVKSVLHHQGKTTQQFIPRFSGSIERITVSEDGNTVVLVLGDNSIQILNSQMEVMGTVRGLIHSKQGNNVGLQCDWAGVAGITSRGSIWTNSLPGSVQCFRTSLRKALFSLDVTGLNLPPSEIGVEPKVADVTKLVVGEQGWIVTVDKFESENFGLETNMKFWKFNPKSEKFELNTRVENPHSGDVIDLALTKFSPEESSPGGDATPSTSFAVTVGSDGVFKIWAAVDESTTYETKEGWVCELTGNLEEQSAQSCAFSEDGTVLAVGFGDILTGWKTVEGIRLFAEKMEGGGHNGIRQILWGSKILGEEYVVIARSAAKTTAWNCLTGAQLWTLDEAVTAMCRDRISGEIAMIQDSSVRLIGGSSDEPTLLVHADTSNTVSATFVPEASGLPRRGGVETTEATQSRLYLLNKSQELFCLCPSSEADRIARRGIADLADEEEKQTAYTSLLKDSSAMDESQKMEVVDPLETHKANIKLLEGPAHAQPPLKVLAPAFILSCLAPPPRD